MKEPTKGEGRLAVSQGVEPWGGVVCGFNLIVDLGGARIRPPPRVSAPSAGAVGAACGRLLTLCSRAVPCGPSQVSHDLSAL